MVPEKFHPSKSFPFPKRSFGSKGETRSFRAEWCEKHSWLHYDASTDAAFCHLCMMTEVEKKFKASTKHELTFISKGYTNWKDACEAFQKHFNSDCHKEAVESIELPLKTGDVGEMLCTEHKKEKEANRAMLRKIIESIRYLARQGLALRGHKDEADSNFRSFYFCGELIV